MTGNDPELVDASYAETQRQGVPPPKDRRPGKSTARRWQRFLHARRPDAEALAAAGNSTSSRLITAASRAVSAAVFRSLYRLEVDGLANLPPDGPLLLIANHTSVLDPFILGASLPAHLAQQVYYLGFESFFRNPLVAWWGRRVRVIPVGECRYLSRALQTAARVLRNRKILCVFPEGQRSATGQLQPFYKGTGILARELLVPVLPTYIRGAFEAWPRGQAFPRIHPLLVRFGAVLPAGRLLYGDTGPIGADSAETAVLRMEAALRALAAPVGESQRNLTDR